MQPTTQQQTQQYAQQQAEHALQQLGAAHGILSGIDWSKVIQLGIQLIQALQPPAGAPAAMQPQAGQKQKTP